MKRLMCLVLAMFTIAACSPHGREEYGITDLEFAECQSCTGDEVVNYEARALSLATNLLGNLGVDSQPRLDPIYVHLDGDRICRSIAGSSFEDSDGDLFGAFSDPTLCIYAVEQGWVDTGVVIRHLVGDVWLDGRAKYKKTVDALVTGLILYYQDGLVCKGYRDVPFVRLHELCQLGLSKDIIFDALRAVQSAGDEADDELGEAEVSAIVESFLEDYPDSYWGKEE